MSIDPALSPVISVVTVVWNNLHGLKQTVSSLEAQSYDRFEHVVIDGGSADGTPDWLRKYSPTFPVASRSEPDKGLYDAMNKGASIARGSIILFLNGGDTLASVNVLELVAESWNRTKWAWGYGQLLYVNEDRKVLDSFDGSPFRARRLELGLTFVPHPTTFMARDLFTRLGGFGLAYGHSADQELMVRAARLVGPPEVWDFPTTFFLVGGAHADGSLVATARRYHQIRKDNKALVLSSLAMDSIYTRSIGAYWQARDLVWRTLKGAERRY